MKEIKYDEVEWNRTSINSNYVIDPKEYFDADVYTKNHKKVCLSISFKYDVNINISIDCHDGSNANLLESRKIDKDVKFETAVNYCWVFDTNGCEWFKFRIKNDDKDNDVLIGKVKTGFIKKERI